MKTGSISFREWCIQNNQENLLESWDYENNSETPDAISYGSNKKIFWKCNKCGTRWQTSVANRTGHGTGCPGCSGRVVVPGKTDMLSIKPFLRDSWDYEKNDLIDPRNEMISSKKEAYWICPLCGESYKKQIRIVAGQGKKYCDSCSKRFQTSFPEQTIFYYLLQSFPDAINRYTEKGFELDIYIPSIMMGIEYDGRAWHSSQRSREKDREKNRACLEQEIQLIRFRESGCPQINDCETIEVKPYSDESLQNAIGSLFSKLHIVGDVNIKRDYSAILWMYRSSIRNRSVGFQRPDLAQEFDESRNGLSPFDIPLNSNRKFWWRCPRGHDGYAATPNNRNRGSGCPICGREKQLKTLHENTILQNGLLKDIHPELLREINNEALNEPVDLEALQSRDDMIYIPWKCKDCGFTWSATVYSRTVLNHGCPSCGHSQGIRKRNTELMQKQKTSILDRYPELAEEWHPTKNGELTAADVSYGSQDKVWWICPKCGNEYQMTPNNRSSRQSGCPICGEKKKNEAKNKKVQNVETGQIFESVKAANAYYGRRQTNISAVCRGERRTALGYHWRYTDDD